MRAFFMPLLQQLRNQLKTGEIPDQFMVGGDNTAMKTYFQTFFDLLKKMSGDRKMTKIN
jgi:hypothetical protein